MLPYFKNKQEEILAYKEYLDKHNVVIDKTNKMFLDLILNILNYLGTENPDTLDELVEYNIRTMHQEFEAVIEDNDITEKAQGILLTFFLRMSKEIDTKYSKIENEYLAELYRLMTSKNFKYPSYISFQKNFALEKMPQNIERMLYFK